MQGGTRARTARQGLTAALLLSLAACGGGGGGSSDGASAPPPAPAPAPTPAPVPAPSPAAPSFRPTVVALQAPPIAADCPASATANAQARIERLWLAQTHLMESDWPFFYLVEARPTLLKLDVSGPAGSAAPTARVTARWPDGRSETRCLRAPAALPVSVDLRPQPQQQSLDSSYALTLPPEWLRAGLALQLQLEGGATLSRSAAELKVGSQPELGLVVLNTLLFGDTQARPLEDAATELAARLPVSRLRVAQWTFDLSLPRLVLPPRSDSPTPTGGLQATVAQWAERKPSCSAADRAASRCLPYSGFAVLAATIDLADALQKANGMAHTSIWYANHGLNSGVGGGLGGGNTGSGDNLGLIFNHELGHAMGLPHLGDVTGSRQTSSTGLMHPYWGETPRDDGQASGGGFGRTAAYDPLDNGLVQATCASSGFEQQDPMQRGCNTVRPGRRFDHFSDAASFKLLRYFNGAPSVASGTVPYHSRLLAGSGPQAFQPARYQFPAEEGRAQLREDAGVWSLHRWSVAQQSYLQLQRPPGGDAGFLSAPPVAAAGQMHEQFHDFRYPQQFDVPVITVLGTFNHASDDTSTVYTVRAGRGHLMRLWDPTQPEQFAWIQRSSSGNTFWWGYDLHLRVRYTDGSLRHVAMPYEAKAGLSAMQGFVTWAVNLPDDGRNIASVELLHRPLCSRNGAASDRSCDVNLPANGISAATVYDGARVAARWSR
jgi:Peptidase M66